MGFLKRMHAFYELPLHFNSFSGLSHKRRLRGASLSLLADRGSEECQKLHNFKSAVKTLRRKNPKKVGKLRHFTFDLHSEKNQPQKTVFKNH